MGVEISGTARESEEEWTFPDYRDSKSHIWDDTKIKAEWQKLLDGPHEREGSGLLAKIWIPKRRMRIRDRKTFEQNQIDHSSKAVKNMKGKDVKDLISFVKKCGAEGASSSDFLRSAFGSGSGGGEKKSKKKNAKDDESSNSEADSKSGDSEDEPKEKAKEERQDTPKTKRKK